jgi:hypothetical protein
VPEGSGRLRVFVEASLNASTTSNQLVSLHFGSAQNALIDAGNQTGLLGDFTVGLPAGTTQTSFVARRATPGQPTTVQLVVADACGDWPTFVGGGPTAF